MSRREQTVRNVRHELKTLSDLRGPSWTVAAGPDWMSSSSSSHPVQTNSFNQFRLWDQSEPPAGF